MNPIKPMLAVSGQPFNSPEWIFEPKIDGTRCLAEVTSSGVRLYNRRLFAYGKLSLDQCTGNARGKMG